MSAFLLMQDFFSNYVYTFFKETFYYYRFFFPKGHSGLKLPWSQASPSLRLVFSDGRKALISPHR